MDAPPSAAVLAAVRAAADRGAWVLAVCTAAFTVAAAGVLDGTCRRRGYHRRTSSSTSDVIGCVYIYPPSGQGPGGTGGTGPTVRSWVRADHAALDAVLHDTVLAWLERDWPFDSIEYAPRT